MTADELDPAPRPKPPETPAEWCEWCDFIARVRADERERIAQAIEAAMESHLNCPHPECAQSYRDAACIARGEEQP